jgi:hypothetical protein
VFGSHVRTRSTATAPPLTSGNSGTGRRVRHVETHAAATALQLGRCIQHQTLAAAIRQARTKKPDRRHLRVE